MGTFLTPFSFLKLRVGGAPADCVAPAQVWHLCRLADLANQLLLGAERDKIYVRSLTQLSRASASLGWQGSCVLLFILILRAGSCSDSLSKHAEQ